MCCFASFGVFRASIRIYQNDIGSHARCFAADGKGGNKHGVRFMRLREKVAGKVSKILLDDKSLQANLPHVQDGQ